MTAIYAYIDLLPQATPRPIYTVPLLATQAKPKHQRALPLSLKITRRALRAKQGYIAGTADGIVTVAGQPVRREILCMDANTRDYKFVCRVWSLTSGHYLIPELDPNKQYLVMVRDYKREYEPFAYDYVTPATDLTVAEQQELWSSWQSE